MQRNQSGKDLMSDPVLNKGTAFNEEERTEFGLHGLLPPVTETLEQQCVRAYEAYKERMTIWSVIYFCGRYRIQMKLFFTLFFIAISPNWLQLFTLLLWHKVP